MIESVILWILVTLPYMLPAVGMFTLDTVVRKASRGRGAKYNGPTAVLSRSKAKAESDIKSLSVYNIPEFQPGESEYVMVNLTDGILGILPRPDMVKQYTGERNQLTHDKGDIVRVASGHENASGHHISTSGFAPILDLNPGQKEAVSLVTRTVGECVDDDFLRWLATDAGLDEDEVSDWSMYTANLRKHDPPIA